MSGGHKWAPQENPWGFFAWDKRAGEYPEFWGRGCDWRPQLQPVAEKISCFGNEKLGPALSQSINQSIRWLKILELQLAMASGLLAMLLLPKFDDMTHPTDPQNH